MFFILFKGIPYYTSEVNKPNRLILFNKVMLHYFIKNIILLFLSIYAIYRILTILEQIDVRLFNYSEICGSIFSIILSILYLENLPNITYTLPTYESVTKISKTYTMYGFYLLIVYLLALFILSHSLTIYCSDGDGEKYTNYQVNDNIQRNRPASPTFTFSSDSESETPQPNVQKNINIQENVEGSQTRSCQVNKNVQVNSSSTPNRRSIEANELLININFIKKIKYPMVELVDIKKFADNYLGLTLDLDNGGYDSDDTVKGDLLQVEERRGIVRKHSHAEIIVQKKLEEVKVRQSLSLSLFHMAIAASGGLSEGHRIPRSHPIPLGQGRAAHHRRK